MYMGQTNMEDGSRDNNNNFMARSYSVYHLEIPRNARAQRTRVVELYTTVDVDNLPYDFARLALESLKP